MDVSTFILAAFRLVSAAVVTGAALYVGWELLLRHTLRPTFVWWYTLSILSLNAVYRWFVVWLLFEEQESIYAYFQPWLGPMSQTIEALLAMVIIVLAFTHVSRMTAHYRTHHDGPEGFDE